MSRFSKSAAEKAGWVFVHSQAERVARSRDTQGREQRLAPSYRAEKYVETRVGGETLINEEADSMGLLLERIHAYEEHRSRIEETGVPEDDASNVYPYGDIPSLKLTANPKIASEKNGRDQADNETQLGAGDPFRDAVHTPDGDFNEHEFFGRRTKEAKVAHENFLERQRELELAKPIDPTATKGERNEEVTPQNFGPPLPAVEVELSKAPGGERTEEEKKVSDKSKPSDTEKEAEKQDPGTKGKAGSKEQPAVPTFRGSDSPPEDAPEDQLVEAPPKSPTAKTEERAKRQVAAEEPKETTTGVQKQRKALVKEKS